MTEASLSDYSKKQKQSDGGVLASLESIGLLIGGEYKGQRQGEGKEG